MELQKHARAKPDRALYTMLQIEVQPAQPVMGVMWGNEGWDHECDMIRIHPESSAGDRPELGRLVAMSTVRSCYYFTSMDN